MTTGESDFDSNIFEVQVPLRQRRRCEPDASKLKMPVEEKLQTP
jgi:hypothetical protein